MATSLKLAVTEATVAGAAPAKLNTIGQTLAVLRFLAAAPRAMGVNAIAREIGMPPSSCFKILKHLYEDGFAEFDHSTKSYSLGGGAVMLARRALDPENTFAFIRPSLVRFASAHDVSVGFWRRIDRDRIVLAGFLESPNPMRIHMSVGQRLPLYIGAVGRAFAGDMDLSDDAIAKELDGLRWRSPPRVADYCEQVREYRRLGYAIDHDNFSPGITTVATLLDDPKGGRGYGLSAIRLSGQTSDRDIRQIGEALVALKGELNKSWLSGG